MYFKVVQITIFEGMVQITMFFYQVCVAQITFIIIFRVKTTIQHIYALIYLIIIVYIHTFFSISV